MNDQILDQDYEPEKAAYYYEKSKKHFKLAFVSLAASIVLILISIRLNFLREIIASLGALLFLFSIMVSSFGTISGIRSYSKQESPTPYRLSILLGNSIILGLFILVVLANVLDFMRFLNE